MTRLRAGLQRASASRGEDRATARPRIAPKIVKVRPSATRARGGTLRSDPRFRAPAVGQRVAVGGARAAPSVRRIRVEAGGCTTMHRRRIGLLQWGQAKASTWKTRRRSQAQSGASGDLDATLASRRARLSFFSAGEGLGRRGTISLRHAELPAKIPWSET